MRSIMFAREAMRGRRSSAQVENAAANICELDERFVSSGEKWGRIYIV